MTSMTLTRDNFEANIMKQCALWTIGGSPFDVTDCAADFRAVFDEASKQDGTPNAASF